MNPFTDNTGKVMTKRIQARDRTTVLLTYSASDANALRMLAQTIQLRGDRKPSLSLLARRAMTIYRALLDSSPAAFDAEVRALDKMVTPVPKPAPLSKRQPA